MSGPVEVSATIAASPQDVYGLVADLIRMGEWSPETSEISWLDGAAAPAPGARFQGANRNGPWRWKTLCTVVTAEPGREISWRSSTFGRSVALWRYRFEPDGHGGTTVTESTEDERGTLLRVLAPLATGVRDRASHNAQSMRSTLELLKAEAERTTT